MGQSVKERLAENPETGTVILSRLAEDQRATIRFKVAGNGAAPRAVMDRLARDASLKVRYGLAGNLGAPEPVLNMLAGDSNPLVANRARKTLASKRVLYEAGRN